MVVLQATQDIRKVSLWLGHSNLTTTEVYVRADPTEKLEAIEAVVPPSLRKGRLRPPPNSSCRQSASPPYFTPGSRTSIRTLTHDAGHYHLLRFQRTDDADSSHCPLVVLACLSAGAARRCFEPVRHPNPCGEFPRG